MKKIGEAVLMALFGCVMFIIMAVVLMAVTTFPPRGRF